MNSGVERQHKRRKAERAAERALTEGYTCAEKYDLGACNVPNGTCDNCTEGTLSEPARKTMFPPGTIETFTGDVYNFQSPDPESIHLEDIAHALSNHCRYAGHTKRFYSVGEHSVLVSRILEAQGYSDFVQLLGLFHDAHEAYVMDAPRPLKPLLGDAFKQVAMKADAVIATWLENAADVHLMPASFEMGVIKTADNIALVYERKQLMTAGPDEWEPGYEDVPELPCELHEPVLGLHPNIVKQSFLNRAVELGVDE